MKWRVSWLIGLRTWSKTLPVMGAFSDSIYTAPKIFCCALCGSTINWPNDFSDFFGTFRRVYSICYSAQTHSLITVRKTAIKMTQVAITLNCIAYKPKRDHDSIIRQLSTVENKIHRICKKYVVGTQWYCCRPIINYIQWTHSHTFCIS